VTLNLILPVVMSAAILLTLFLAKDEAGHVMKVAERIPVTTEKVALFVNFAGVLFWFLINLGVIMIMSTGKKGYDNKTPRDTKKKMSEKSMAFRLTCAHNNQLEANVCFGVMTMLGLTLGLEATLFAKLAVIYAVSRVAFVVAYALDADLLRTFVFLLGFISTVLIGAMSLFPEMTEIVNTFDIKQLMAMIQQQR